MTNRRTLQSRWARIGLGAAGLGLAGLVAHDAARIVRIKRIADTATELDHDAVVGAGLGEPLRLVVLGDSAAAGHGLDDPSRALPQRIGVQLAKASGRRVSVRSLAVDGATTPDVAKFQVPRLRQQPEDIVVLNVGVNDALRARVAADLEEQTELLVAGIRDRQPEAHLVVVETPDLSSAPGIPFVSGLVVRRRCRRVRAIQRRAARRVGVPIVELPDRLDRTMFGRDGFHPGAEGLEAIADRVVAEVVAA